MHKGTLGRRYIRYVAKEVVGGVNTVFIPPGYLRRSPCGCLQCSCEGQVSGIFSQLGCCGRIAFSNPLDSNVRCPVSEATVNSSLLQVSSLLRRTATPMYPFLRSSFSSCGPLQCAWSTCGDSPSPVQVLHPSSVVSLRSPYHHLPSSASF